MSYVHIILSVSAVPTQRDCYVVYQYGVCGVVYEQKPNVPGNGVNTWGKTKSRL